MVQIKLSINDLAKNPRCTWNQYPAWKEKVPKRFSSYLLRCYIFQCRDLPSADAEGSSDPYIKVWNCDNKDVKTKCIEDNLNPIFYETVDVPFEFHKKENAPPIVLDLWDQDPEILGIGEDDFLGRAVISLSQSSLVEQATSTAAQIEQVPTPRWHDVKASFVDAAPSCGQVLCSFALVEPDFKFSKRASEVRISREVPTKDYVVDINVLGLRDLASFGIMPVRKAFCQFNIRSLLPPEKAEAVKNIKTQPKMAGPNPNINTLISFGTCLPTSELFCPKLACEVYDFVCKGMSQPKVGSFVINIGEIMQE